MTRASHDGGPRVRLATERDALTLAGFNRAMALETEGRELDRDAAEAGVAAVIDDATRGHYLVAELDGQPAGALLVTPEWSDWRNAWFWWIQSVYVAVAHRRRGVFRALHAAVLARARARGDVCGVRLYVERDNGAALRTYVALGLRRSEYLLLEQELG